MSNLLFVERVAVEPEVTPSAGLERWEGAWPRTREEFGRFVDVFQDRLVWFAFSKLGNRSEAEEVAQEVFLRAYRHQEERRNVSRVSSYLYRMASNACNDVLRKRSRATLPLSLSKAENIADPRARAGENAAALDELQRTETLLARLPRPQAEAVRLRVFDELGFAEIAEVLHCSLGTAKSRFRHGLRKLQALLELEREN